MAHMGRMDHLATSLAASKSIGEAEATRRHAALVERKNALMSEGQQVARPDSQTRTALDSVQWVW